MAATPRSAWLGTVRVMKQAFALVGLGLLLASCNTASTGSASVTLTGIRTEYRTAGGQYVACDNVSNNGAITGETQVATDFRTSGDFQNVRVRLRGNTSTANDNNFVGNFSRATLESLGGTSFSAVFTADAEQGQFLPQAIVVNPVQRNIKIVETVGASAGSFFAEVTVTDSFGNTATADTRILGNTGNIPVYTGCNVISTTNEQI